MKFNTMKFGSFHFRTADTYLRKHPTLIWLFVVAVGYTMSGYGPSFNALASNGWHRSKGSTSGGGTTSTGGATSGSGSTSSGSGSSSGGGSGPTSPADTCTLYVAANGSSSNSGTTTGSPLTLQTAAQVAVAGDVVCIAPGNYNIPSTIYPSHSGTAADWITYTSYGTGAVNVLWTGASGQAAIFNMYGTFPNGPSYISFNGLTLNGQNQVSNGFFCYGSHHLAFTNNTISNMGSSGIASYNCDYMRSDHNTIFHSGYAVGWSSAISYAYLYSFDSYAGFHNIMSNNIVAGEYDASTYHSDGNGLILDDGGNSLPANTPASLIVNNVSYGNGGRCIETNTVSQAWIVNNTCYDNDLDTSQPNDMEVMNHSSNNVVFVNNIVESWNSQPTYSTNGSNNSNVNYSYNLSYGGSSSGASGTNYVTANAQFINPPAYNPTAGGQYANTISPSALGNGLDLQSTSPAINAGTDPTSLAGSNSAIKSDLSKYIYSDINGDPRPVGGPFTLGAYQK